MIKPGEPQTMWAAHDKLLDTYAFPLPAHVEAATTRDAQLRHLTEAERERLFPIVPVTVTITPGRYALPDPSRQFPLFGEDHAPKSKNP